jgi:photosystem II stability/assembly factor-like uncharacterized protein
MSEMIQNDSEPNAAKKMFVAVGHKALRLTSVDGIAWTNLQTGKEGEVYRAVCFGNGHFAAVGSYGGSNIFASTTDGQKWDTSTKDARYVTYLRGLGFGKQMLLGLGGDPGAVGDSRPFIMTSEDGKTWSEAVSIAGKNLLRRVCYGNDRFVAVGDRGRRASSKDAKEWIDTPDVKAIDTLIDVTFGNGIFVGVGLHGLRMSSEDGIKWSERLPGEEGEHVNSVIWTGDKFVAVGQGATYFSPDGRKWERTPNLNAPLIAVAGDGVFVGSNWKGRLLRSTDAVKWEDVFQAEQHVEALAFG